MLEYVLGDDGKKHLTMPDDRRASIVAYIRETAERSPDEIAAALQEGHDGVIAALDGLSEAQAQYKPGPDDWSVLELLDHVVTVKRAMVLLATSLSQGTWPAGFDEDSQSEDFQDGVTFVHFNSLAEAREAVDAAHDELMSFAASINERMNTKKQFRHFFFGAMNCRQWVVFQRIHDADHAPGIAKIKASPGFPPA